MPCKNCEHAKRAYLGLTKLMPRGIVQTLSVKCRLCGYEWYGVPEQEKP